MNLKQKIEQQKKVNNLKVSDIAYNVSTFLKTLGSEFSWCYYFYNSTEQKCSLLYFNEPSNLLDAAILQKKSILLNDPTDIFTQVHIQQARTVVKKQNSNELLQYIFEKMNPSFILIYPIIMDSVFLGFFLLTSSGKYTNRIIDTISLMLEQTTPVLYSATLKKQLKIAKEKLFTLLANFIPPEIAHELEEKGSVEPIKYESLSILFTDFVGFSKIAENLTAEELVTMLDGYFFYFDDITKKYGLERLKTIGDAYMGVGGFIDKDPKIHSIKTCLCALEFCNFTKMMMEVTQRQSLIWDIRVGVNTGPAIGGVIGKTKFAFDIWGSNVNIASRMESSSLPGKVNISESTFELVKDFFETECRGVIEVKNGQQFSMYFLHKIKEDYSDEDGIFPNEKLLEIIGMNDIDN